MQHAFKEIKRLAAEKTKLKYPDINIKFIIHMDASDSQLGATISQ